MKALGSHIEGWKHQMNDAGAQAAAVLALVQSDGSEIRYLRWTLVLCTPAGLAQQKHLSWATAAVDNAAMAAASSMSTSSALQRMHCFE